MKVEYDVITIGSGPGGLICAVTAVMGIPIKTAPQFSGLIIEKEEVGSFARYGKLRITPNWHLMGYDVINHLLRDVKTAGLHITTKERVLQTDLNRSVKMVKTDKGTYYCKKLAVCTGFFPYGHFCQYRNQIRVMFSPIETEVYFLPKDKGFRIAVMGGEHGTFETAEKLKFLRPDLDVTVILSDPGIKSASTDIPGNGAFKGDVLTGNVRVKKEKRDKIILNLYKNDEKGKDKKCGEWEGRIVLVHYNSYVRNTHSTSFLNDPRITMVNGYIKVDEKGNTGVPGVVAAGNIVTPVSGVITALSTGFTAGLNLNEQLWEEQKNSKPLHFPWLPLDDPGNHPLL